MSTPSSASVEYVGHCDRSRRPRRRATPHRSAAPEPRRAPAPGGQGRRRRPPRRRRGADLAPPLRPPRPAVAAAARPRDRRSSLPAAPGALIRRKAGVKNVLELRRRGADRDRGGDGAGDPRRARHGPAAVRRPRRAARVRDRGWRAARSTSPATRTSSTRWPSSRRSTSRCCRSGAGGRRWGRATWTRSARREAAALLGARLAIPIHWGTYYPIHLGMQGPPAFLATPPPLFEQAVREHSPGTEVRVLRPGEKTEI